MDYARLLCIFHIFDEDRKYLNIINRRKAYWIGHILLRNSLLKQLLEER